MSWGPDKPMERVTRSRAATRNYYDKIAGVYDLLAEHAERPMREAGLGKLAAGSGEDVLEIGYGTGHCIVRLARAVGPSGRVHGLDLSERMRELALARAEQAGLAGCVELRTGDAVSLPYDESVFDAVFMSFTLELFDTPEIPVVLGECRRVLRPEGRVVVVAVSREGQPGLMVNLYEWMHEHFPNLLDCRPIYAQRAIEQAGFHVESTSIESVWIPVEIVRAANPGAVGAHP